MTLMNVIAPAGRAKDDDQPAYEPHHKVYPQKVRGVFRRTRWAVLIITLGIYYLTPFIRWNRGAGAPGQAVLLDLPNRRFYFFFIEIWPQEVYYLTGLLVLAALVLFLMNAVAGRIWCGYLCPQTVWTDLFLAIERWTEGDRRSRMKNDAGPLTPSLVARKALKHFLWLMTAWWTGGAWVLYFGDAPTLVRELATLQAPLIAYIWIGILTFTTYSLAGYMREQVCLYMCPWPRIQAALTDEDAFNVSYRFDRGEPRLSAKKAAVARSIGEPAGDCIDCDQCVAVCPTGVDIRDGASLGCIQCGLCIDACDTVMSKLGRPTRLIAYDTDVNIRARAQGQPETARIVRPRTLLYAAVILIVGALMMWGLTHRVTTGINVIHDRNPEYVVLSDGGVRNAYTLRILNKDADLRKFAIAVDLPGAALDVVGADAVDGKQVAEVGPDQTRELRAIVSLDHSAGNTQPIRFTITDRANGKTAGASDNFRGPGAAK